MKLSHHWFLRFTVAVGCIGTLVHTYQTITREAYSIITPWWGAFGFFSSLCLYGLVWAVTPQNWWKD